MAATYLRFFKVFRTFCGPQFWVVLALVAASALTEGVGLFLLLPVLQLMSEAETTGIALWVITQLAALGIDTLRGQLGTLIALVTTLIILRAVLGWFRAVYVTRIETDVVNNFRITLFSGLAHANWETLSALRHGAVQNSLVQDLGRLSQATTNMMRSLINVVLVTVQLAVSAIIALELTLLILIMAAVCAALGPRLMRSSKRNGERLTQAGLAFHDHLLQFFNALKLMKIQREEAEYITFFRSRVLDMRTELLQFNQSVAGFQAAFQIVNAILLGATLTLGIFVLETPFTVLAAVVIIVARASGPAISLMRTLQTTANAMPAFSAYEALVQDLKSPGPDTNPNATPPKAKGPVGIEAQHITYGHGSGEGPILHGMSFSVKPGEIVAITGKSGSGKTTLLDLICGIISPSSGALTVGGAPADQGPTGTQVAYVTQDAVLFDISVRENLTFGITGITDDGIHSALAAVGASERVARLPEGLDTRCGQGGSLFSGGERQRLALARALLRKPDLLLLDEATSALDMTSEREILARIAELRGSMTIVLVTHRTIPDGLIDQEIPLTPRDDRP